MRFLELAKRNFKEIYRDRLYLGFLLGIPIALMLILGAIFGGQSTAASALGIVNQDGSPPSQAFEEVLKNVPSFDIRHYNDLAKAREDLKFGDIKAFITIPPGFGEQVEKNWQGTRENINLKIAYDQTDPLLAQRMLAIVKEMSATFSKTKPPLIINEKTVQPKAGLLNWMVPGAAVFGLLLLILIAAGKIVMDKEKGVLSRLLTSPLKPWEFVMGYALPFCLMGAVQMLIFIAVGLLVGLKIYGSAALAFLFLFLSGLCCVGIGMIVGSLAKTESQVTAIGNGLIWPLSFFVGCWMPWDLTPAYFQKVAYALPFAHAADAVRAILTKEVGFGVIATDFYWLIGWTIILFAAGIVVFRKRMTI